jgi:D-lyxose ketol-isomerase
MKRSEINQAIEDGLSFVEQMGFAVPAFARWSPAEWRQRGAEYDELRDNMLGWDVSDLGTGDFVRVGLLILTIRNGNLNDSRYPKPYGEKILIQGEDQVLPFHFHHKKAEDIINRGGGHLILEVANSGPHAEFLDTPVEISVDGHRRRVARGETLRLAPGESATIQPLLFHRFWAKQGFGRVLVGEVSSVNDDRVDNYFPEYGERLPEIIEDEPARFLLFKDYPALGSFDPNLRPGAGHAVG